MWTGFGIVGTSLLGALLFREKLSLPQLLCVGLIVVGIVGLKLLPGGPQNLPCARGGVPVRTLGRRG